MTQSDSWRQAARAAPGAGRQSVYSYIMGGNKRTYVYLYTNSASCKDRRVRFEAERDSNVWRGSSTSQADERTVRHIARLDRDRLQRTLENFKETNAVNAIVVAELSIGGLGPTSVP